MHYSVFSVQCAVSIVSVRCVVCTIQRACTVQYAVVTVSVQYAVYSVHRSACSLQWALLECVVSFCSVYKKCAPGEVSLGTQSKDIVVR